jgi:hypothetical protein
MESGTKPDALGTRPYHCTNMLKLPWDRRAERENTLNPGA